MPTTLTRIDAQYVCPATGDLVAAISIFAGTDHFARHWAARQARHGWDVRRTEIDAAAEQLTRHDLAGLVGPVWPLAPLDELLALLREPPASVAGDVVFEPTESPVPKEDSP